MAQHYRQHQNTREISLGDGTEYLAPAGCISRCGQPTDPEGGRPATTTDKAKIDFKLCLAGLRCSPYTDYQEKAGRIVPELPSFNRLRR